MVSVAGEVGDFGQQFGGFRGICNLASVFHIDVWLLGYNAFL
jgi:hypothetical protein